MVCEAHLLDSLCHLREHHGGALVWHFGPWRPQSNFPSATIIENRSPLFLRFLVFSWPRRAVEVESFVVSDPKQRM